MFFLPQVSQYPLISLQAVAIPEMSNPFVTFIRFIEPSGKDKLKNAIKELNASLEDNDEEIYLTPDDFPDNTSSSEITLYQQDKWTVEGYASILRNAGVRTRNAGNSLSKGALARRLRQVWEEKAKPSVFEPTMIGENWMEFWKPWLDEFIKSIVFVLITMAVTMGLFRFVEYFHAEWKCNQIFEFFSMWCYATKKTRSFLEEQNYNMAYQVLTGLGIRGAMYFFNLRQQFMK